MAMYIKSAHIGFDPIFRETVDIVHVPFPVGLTVARIGFRLRIAPPIDKTGGANMAVRFSIRFLD